MPSLVIPAHLADSLARLAGSPSVRKLRRLSQAQRTIGCRRRILERGHPVVFATARIAVASDFKSESLLGICRAAQVNPRHPSILNHAINFACAWTSTLMAEISDAVEIREITKKFGIGLGDAAGILDTEARELQTDDRKRHRNAMVIVGLDRRGLKR